MFVWGGQIIKTFVVFVLTVQVTRGKPDPNVIYNVITIVYGGEYSSSGVYKALCVKKWFGRASIGEQSITFIGVFDYFRIS